MPAQYSNAANGLRAYSLKDLGKDLGNAAKKAGNWVEKNITQPVVKLVKDPVGQIGEGVDSVKKFADENIGRPFTDAVVKPIKRGLGLEETPTPESVKPKIDPSKAAALAKYGEMAQAQAGQFNPAAYGPNYFQARTFTPTITTGTANMPGIYSPQNATPATPGVQQTPNLQNVGAQDLQLRDVATGTGLDLYKQKSAIANAMAQYQQPQTIEAGYGDNFVENYVQRATSGLEQQKNEAMARLKEEQMKSGNFGSSVGQKQMSDLAASYDRQAAEAGNEANILQAQALREDRYANINADLARTSMLGNLAGQGANLELTGQGYARDTAQLQNQVAMIKADFERQGIQIDNNTAMQMAQYGAGQTQQDFANRMSAAEFGRQGEQASYESQWRRYLAGQDVAAGQDALRNQADMFNIGLGDVADTKNYNAYQDVLRNLSTYGSDLISPQSQLDYNLWLQQQAQKNQRLASTIDWVTKFIP